MRMDGHATRHGRGLGRDLRHRPRRGFRRGLSIALAGFAAIPGPAPAQERPYTPSMSCAALKATVDRLGDVVLATSANAYEAVHRDAGACTDDVTSAPAFVPAADAPQCFAGYRCRQRDNGNDSSR